MLLLGALSSAYQAVDDHVYDRVRSFLCKRHKVRGRETPCGDLSAGETRTLLYVGRIHPGKGVESLLRAWREIQGPFPQWRLQIVGPGKPPDVAKMKALAVAIGLGRCEFAGPLYGVDNPRTSR